MRMADSSLYIVNPARLPSYSVDDPVAQAFASKFRELRLRALQLSPEAFASTYHEEEQRGIALVLERLENAKADHFFLVEAAAEHDLSNLGNILGAKWLGMIVLIELSGSESDRAAVSASKDPFSRMRATTEDGMVSGGATSNEAYYQLNGTFVDPLARGGGYGKGLIDAAVKKAVLRAGQAVVRFTVFVSNENLAAKALYEKAGFVVTGKEAYVQRIWSHGAYQKVERVALRLEMTAVAPHRKAQ